MKREQTFLLALVGVAVAASAALILPYLQYVLLAVLLAYVLTPLQRRLAPLVGRRTAAATLMVVTVFVVLLPVVAVARVVLREAPGIADAVREAAREVVPARLSGLTRIDLDVSSLLASTGGDGVSFAGGVASVLGGLSNALVGVVVLLFVLYYLLVDGDSLVRWLRRTTPLAPVVQDELYARIDRLTWAVLVGNGAVALVQGALTGVGLWALGVPSPLFWAAVTTVLSLLPLIGASVVWLPASVYLFLSGDPVAAVALLAYGSVVVSLSDNYLRPIIGGREADLNPGLFIVGIFGGIATVGVMGLFYGPIILGGAKALIELYGREYATGGDRAPAVGATERAESRAADDEPAESGS